MFGTASSGLVRALVGVEYLEDEMDPVRLAAVERAVHCEVVHLVGITRIKVERAAVDTQHRLRVGLQRHVYFVAAAVAGAEFVDMFVDLVADLEPGQHRLRKHRLGQAVGHDGPRHDRQQQLSPHAPGRMRYVLSGVIQVGREAEDDVPSVVETAKGVLFPCVLDLPEFFRQAGQQAPGEFANVHRAEAPDAIGLVHKPKRRILSIVRYGYILHIQATLPCVVITVHAARINDL